MIATSLIPLVNNFSEICALIIGFSFTVWTESLVGSLTDGVLADAILIPSPPTDTAHQLKEGKGSAKKVRKQVTEKSFTSK